MENELLDNTTQEMEYIGDIPEGWKWVKLGDEIEIISGGTPKTNKLEYWNGNIPWLTIADFNNVNKYVDKAQKTITEIGLSESSTKLLKPGDIIISARGTIGAIAVVKKEMAFNQSCYGIRSKSNEIYQDFLYYLLKNSINMLLKNSYGAVFDTITRETFSLLFCPLPPLPEQKAIADVLSSIDDKIELLHRQNKTLEEMAMTLFRQWFIEPTKDGLPDGLEEVSLGDSELSQIIPSGIKKFEGFKTYLATGDVEGTLIKGGVEITYNKRPSRANMQPEKYSVWFAKKEGVRKLLMFDDYSNTDKYILSTGFTGLKTNELGHYYIWCFILSEDFQDIKDSLVSGSVQPDIPNEAVLQIFIPRPPDTVLLSFNEKVKPLFTKIQFNTSQIQTLEKLRDTLLPKLMSGEIRVKI